MISVEAEGGDLRGLDDHRAAGDQGRDGVAEREDQREVPGADHADDRIGPVLDPQLLDLHQRRVRRHPLVADELVALLPVEVDQVRDVDGLAGGLAADLAGLALHRVGDLVLVVEDPVAELVQPLRAALDPERLPGGLVGADAGDGRGDLGGPVERNAGDHRSVGRVGGPRSSRRKPLARRR